MIKKIVMPAAGQTTDAATVTRIKVAAGDKVKRGDILLEVETDKATLPIESVATGTVVRICVSEFERIDAGSLLLEIGNDADYAAAQTADTAPAAPAAPAPAPAEEDDDFAPVSQVSAPAAPAPVPVAPAAPAAPAASVRAMPNAKAAAAELGIDLSTVTPANGQFIKKSDVTAAAAAKKPAPEAREVKIDPSVIPTSVMRDSLSAKLDRFAVPAQAVTVSADASVLLRLLAAKSEAAGVKVTAGDFVMLALARLSERFEILAARNEGGTLRRVEGCAFGLAYTGLNGTVSATVSNAAAKSLAAIARENRANPVLLAKGDMSPVGANSVTVFDLSETGIDSFLPTVMTPEVASVGIGTIRERPAAADGVLVLRPTVNITFAYDCRVIDPTAAASLAAQLAALIAEPALML